MANASSVSDIIKEIHQALNENRPGFYRVPDNAALIPQEFLLFENSGSDDLEKVVDSSFRKARFTLQVPWLDVFYYTGLLKKIKGSFQTTFENRAEITTTGLMQLFVHTVKAASLSMAEGYVTAAVLITIMMILLVGGLRMGLVSMIPTLPGHFRHGPDVLGWPAPGHLPPCSSAPSPWALPWMTPSIF